MRYPLSGLSLAALSLALTLATSCGQASNPGQGNTALPSPTTLSPASPTPGPFIVPTLTPPAPTTPSEPSHSSLAARVNGQPITLTNYEQQALQAEAALIAQGVDPNSEEGKEALAQIRRQVLEQMIDQVLIEQSAAREGVVISDQEVQAKIQEMATEMGGEEKLRESLAASGLTYDDFVVMLHAQLVGAAMVDRFASTIPAVAEQIHARHILLSSAEEAQKILARLQAGEDFATLAAGYSQDIGSKDNGGDLGWFPRGTMMPEFEQAAFSLSPGQTSQVVPTPLGYHVIQVLEKDPARELTPEMHLGLQQEAFMRWLEAQRAQATIERFIGQ